MKAFFRRIVTLRGLMALFIAYLALGELYMGVTNLWEATHFFFSSSSKQAQVVDVRQRECDAWYQLLPSGEIAYQGQTLYYPIVSYTSPNFMVPLSLELPAPHTSDYQRGSIVDIRTLDANNLIAQESHGFFLWGGAMIRTAFGLLMLFMGYVLFKRIKLVPRPVVQSEPQPKPESKPATAPAKKPRKKSASPKKGGTPKKKSTGSTKKTKSKA